MPESRQRARDLYAVGLATKSVKGWTAGVGDKQYHKQVDKVARRLFGQFSLAEIDACCLRDVPAWLTETVCDEAFTSVDNKPPVECEVNQVAAHKVYTKASEHFLKENRCSISEEFQPIFDALPDSKKKPYYNMLRGFAY